MIDVYIYALADPTNDKIRYVGKSTDPYKRYYSHLADAKSDRESNKHKQAWIRKILSYKLKPKLIILEVATDENWEDRERYWISHYRDVYADLLNIEDGGIVEGKAFVRLLADDSFREKAREKASNALTVSLQEMHVKNRKAKGEQVYSCGICGKETCVEFSVCALCRKQYIQNGVVPDWLEYLLQEDKKEKDYMRNAGKRFISSGL